jgi:hypothetical protein
LWMMFCYRCQSRAGNSSSGWSNVFYSNQMMGFHFTHIWVGPISQSIVIFLTSSVP